nr:unnamed protein product [Digitaria exilis]
MLANIHQSYTRQLNSTLDPARTTKANTASGGGGEGEVARGITISSGLRMPNCTSWTLATSAGEYGNLASILAPPGAAAGGDDHHHLGFQIAAPPPPTPRGRTRRQATALGRCVE